MLVVLCLGLIGGLMIVADRMHRHRRYVRALKMVEHGEHERAIPYLEYRLERWPDDIDLRFALARALHGADRHAESVEHLEHLLARAPEHGPAHLLLGRTHLALGEHAEAAEHLDRAVELRPDDPVAWSTRGRLHLIEDRPIDAESALRQAQAAGASYGSTEAWLGRALFAQGRIDEALAVLDGALAAHPRSREVHFQLAEVHRLRGSWFVAIERYRAARGLGLDTLACDLGLAIALHEGGAPAEAERELERMTRDHEREAEPWYRLGLLREHEGDADGALVCFERCLSLDPEHAGANEQVQALRRTAGR